MTAIDYEKEYDNRGRVPEHPEIFVRREREARAYRAATPAAELGTPYGPSPRQTLDIFPAPGGAPTPIAMFIHGGYWSMGEPSMYSHLAKGLNGNGVTVAIAGYDLCPAVSMATIIEELRAAVIALWRRYHRRVFVYGHSAGGHLTACMLATDWSRLAADAPADLVPAASATSGIYDLAPLLQVSQNKELRLDEKSARAASPVFWRVPPGRTLDVVVGSTESSEFLRQSRIIAAQWKKAGAVTRYEEIAGANHFTVIEPLADPDSAMTKRVAELAKGMKAIA
jgi:arylformamidase